MLTFGDFINENANEVEDCIELMKAELVQSIDLIRMLMEIGEINDKNSGFVHVVYGNDHRQVTYRLELTVNRDLSKAAVYYYDRMDPESWMVSVEELCLNMARDNGFKYVIMSRDVGLPDFTIILSKDVHVTLSAKDFINTMYRARSQKSPVADG